MRVVINNKWYVYGIYNDMYGIDNGNFGWWSGWFGGIRYLIFIGYMVYIEIKD